MSGQQKTFPDYKKNFVSNFNSVKETGLTRNKLNN